VIDSMGELMRYYAACDVAFVGGSMDRVGGQNVLEPAAMGKPVIFGPHTFNFKEISEQLIDCGAAIRIQDAGELRMTVSRLFNDPELRDQMGQTGMNLVKSGQGALARTLELIDGVFTEAVD
jgi:3-deoxy-D-manno-octulosonic-acid transferase